MSEWIKCSDRLPLIGINHTYLFVNGKHEVTFGYAFDIDSDGTVWINDMERGTNEVAIYWMELPSPPES